jgi:endonuclease YncB( thermonuclease family)
MAKEISMKIAVYGCLSALCLMSAIVQAESPAQALGEIVGANFRGSATVTAVVDFDQVTLRRGDRSLVVALAAVAPLSTWGQDLSPADQALRDEALQFARKVLIGHEFHVCTLTVPMEGRATVDIEWSASGAGPPPGIERHYKMSTPSEKVGWGMTSFNLLLIERGYSPCVPTRFLRQMIVVTDSAYVAQELAPQAEALARSAKLGIWKSATLPRRLATTAPPDSSVLDKIRVYEK